MDLRTSANDKQLSAGALTTTAALLNQIPTHFTAGMAYGIGVYLVMNLIVLPLSAAGRPASVPVAVLNGVLIHMFGVGVPSCLAARAAYGSRS